MTGGQGRRRVSLAQTLMAAGLGAAVASCAPQPALVDVGGQPGLVDGRLDNPFPSAHLLTTDATTPTGVRLRIEPNDLPVPIDGTPMPVDRFVRRDGFSPAGSLVLRLPDWPEGVDSATFSDPSPSLADDAPLRLWDAATGERFPYFAEFDAYPQTEEAPALLIRPVRPFPDGARVIAAVLGSVAPPEPFAAVRGGEGDSAAVQERLDHIFAELSDLGVEREAVVFAWDFVVGTAARAGEPLDHVISALREAVPADPTFAPPFTVGTRLDADLDPMPDPRLWRVLRGTLVVPSFLHAEEEGDNPDTGLFRYDASGLPVRGVDGVVHIEVVVPESVRAAPRGTVPAVIFGHGIFSNPRQYLSESGDPESVITLLDSLGAIGIGTEWRGLCTRDAADALRAARDFGRFPLITDKLVQGVAQAVLLERLFQTAFAQDQWLVAADGGSLVDPQRLYYYGISLGGIEGAVLTAKSERIRASVLHVPGSTWSTMLERSSHWLNFEEFVVPSIPSAFDRQVLYAASQLFWDAVDPTVHAAALRERPILLQVALGDEQVPNFTAWTLARALSMPVVVPTSAEPWGLEQRPGPLPAGSSALMHFEPAVLSYPPLENRPAQENGAHKAVRHWESARTQILGFFAEGAEGTIESPCDGPCTGPPAPI